MIDFLSDLINPHDKRIKELQKRADKIVSLEDNIKDLSDEELKNKTNEFKSRLKKGESLDDILEEAFAVVREASGRILGMKHFSVQLMGGIALHEGNIAQMKTGEGKTLVAVLPAYLNSLTGKGVFVITSNDYLASRDKEEMGKVYEFLGLSVGLTHRDLSIPEKKQAYNCDITYGANSEFGFDYLRDNMVTTKEHISQRSRNFAIIDEVDSILIDEARTPLIITGQSTKPSQYYITVDKFIKSLNENDYEIDNERNIAHITQEGMDKAERIFGIENIADIKNTELLHHIRQSLQANYIMKKDKDYVVKDGEVLIVDKFTGRALPGRRFSKGLHQAIEAKEGLEIKKESKTQAMITYQNYFKMFNKIAGMTGTAYTERQEFKDIYGMDVICIPTNKPVIRIDNPDFLFKTKEAKFKAVIDEVEERYKKGQPVLIGTIYIDESEKISNMLSKRNIPHNILNAKQDKDEAHIISKAGQKGAVTIATNMAGRGTDIKLGEGVEELGGLFVLGTEKHDSRRVDNQLRGRAGRQGDPGESRFFISLEDSLFKKVNKEAIDRVKKIVDKMNISDEDAIEDKLVSQSIEGIQKNVERTNFNIRKNTLEFDQILNKQRETIYSERNKILNGEDMSSFIKEMLKDNISKVVDIHTSKSPYPEEWDLDKIQGYLDSVLKFNKIINFKDLNQDEIENLDKEKLKEEIFNEAIKIYKAKEESIGDKQLRYLERITLMKNIDEKWIDYLDLIDQIRQGIVFQYIGGENPLRIFNKEAFNLFSDMLEEIKDSTIKTLFLIANIDKELNEVKKIKEQHELTQEEKRKRVEELEDKYMVSRWFIPKLPSNIPDIRFNIDINATEEVEAKVHLYYMDNGYEEKLEEYDKEVTIKGVFLAEFKKPNDKNWTMGWYQIKVIVSGQEVKNVNFLITEPVKELENHKLKKLMFFADNNEEIVIDSGLSYNKYEIEGMLVYNKNKIPFKMPTLDNKAKVIMKKPPKGWNKGVYELTLSLEDKKILIPFVIVSEYSKEKNEFTLKMKVKTDKKDAVGKLISIETNKVLGSVPIMLDESGFLTITLKTEILQKGRYEFRVVDEEDNILGNEIFMLS